MQEVALRFRSVAMAGLMLRMDSQVAAVEISASKSSIRRFVSTEKAPTRAFSWLKAATTAFTFKTLLRDTMLNGR